MRTREDSELVAQGKRLEEEVCTRCCAAGTVPLARLRRRDRRQIPCARRWRRSRFGRRGGGEADLRRAQIVASETLEPGRGRRVFDRVRLVRPDLALFVVDTALRLSDKVVPMLTDELARRSTATPAPRSVERDLWTLGRQLLRPGPRAQKEVHAY